MRRAVTPVVPPSLYRHFAVVTVLLTAGVAMVVESENRQAQAAPTARAAPARPATPGIVATNQAAQQAAGWWEADSYADGESEVVPDVETIEAPGYSPDYLDSLSEEERELLLAGLQESGMHDPEMREERSATLIAASSRRSGSDANEN